MNQIFEIERAVLGTILFNPKDHLNSFSLLKSVHFDTYPHQCIFNAMERLYSRNKAIDYLTISSELKEMNVLDSIGGINGISILTNYNLFTELDSHCLLILEAYLKREMLKLGMFVQGKANSMEDIFEIISETESKITNLVKGVINSKIESIEAIKNNVLKEVEIVIASGKKSGILCSVERLNNQTSGWQKSDLVILAGRPGMGKTSAAIDFVLHPALDGIPTAFFSLEMNKEQLASRILSIVSHINVQKIVNKNVNHYELEHIIKESNILNKVPLFIDDTPGLSLLDLKNRSRVLKKENGIELIVVDYLQLMTSKGNKGNREQEISEISRGLKGLAKELNIPIIALSQLSRKCEERADKKPMLSDLRESGAIEQDADIVIFCHRPEYYGIERYQIGNEEISSEGLFMFIISKFRNGSPGEVRARFIHENTMITNYNY